VTTSTLLSSVLPFPISPCAARGWALAWVIKEWSADCRSRCSSLTTTISVLWPAVQLSETGWRQRVEDLATRAELLIGRKCTLQQTAELGLELVGLIWPAIGPETVAASCRASLVMGAPGVLLASSPGDQWAELCQRLDDIYAAAQADPAAAVVELPSVMLQRVIPESHAGRPKRVRAQPQVDEPEMPEPEPEIPEPVAADQRLDGWGFPIESQPAELEDADDVSREKHALPIQAIDTIALGGAMPEPEPSPAPLPPAPPDWFTAAEAAELLSISRSTIARWCKQGRFGEPGDNWLPAGRTFRISPAVLDALFGVPEPREPAQIS
jgi:excisionase family DNA binding protein